MAERLLVIDADEEVRRSYARHFAAAGFEVRTLALFSEAQGLSGPVDAVIADVRRATADAPDAAIAAVLRRTGAATIVLTASGDPARASVAARVGMADAFLHKPVSLVWLEMLVRGRILARREGCPRAVPVSA